MIIEWHCKTCGFATAHAPDAFHHRHDGDHLIRPLTRDEVYCFGLPPVYRGTGIEKHWMEEEIGQHVRR